MIYIYIYTVFYHFLNHIYISQIFLLTFSKFFLKKKKKIHNSCTTSYYTIFHKTITQNVFCGFCGFVYFWRLFCAVFVCEKAENTHTKHRKTQNTAKQTPQNIFFSKHCFTVTVFQKTKKNIHKTHKHKNTRKIAQYNSTKQTTRPPCPCYVTAPGT